ncbi:MAG: ATP-grasp domain-containing protein [Alphaproteobacteria bacterium]
MDGKVLLFTTVKWQSVARYAAGFARAGLNVEAVAPRGAPVRQSRYVTRSHLYRALSPLSSLKKAIARSKPDLLLACDERAVLLLLELHGEADAKISAPIVRSLGNPCGLAALMSRAGSLAAMRDAGVRVPDTFPVADEDELDRLLKETGFPAVLKSDGSWGGDGVIIVHSREEAAHAYRRLAHAPSRVRSLARAIKRRDLHFLAEAIAPAPREVSLQQFVEGTPAASAFAAWQGKVAGVFGYDVLVAEGDIGPPNVIRRVDCPEMADAARLAAARFGLSGLFGMDFIRDADGKPFLIEINPRGTQGGTLPLGPGCDLPAALTECAFGGARPHRPAIANEIVVTFPRLWLSDPQSSWLKIGHHDVPWDDPAVLNAALAETTPHAKKAVRHVHA